MRFTQRPRAGAWSPRSWSSIPREFPGESPRQGGPRVPHWPLEPAPPRHSRLGTSSGRTVSGDPQLWVFSPARFRGREGRTWSKRPGAAQGPEGRSQSPFAADLPSRGSPGLVQLRPPPRARPPARRAGASSLRPALTLAQREPEQPARMPPHPPTPPECQTTFPTRLRGLGAGGGVRRRRPE